MPNYHYLCSEPECEYEFEVVESIKADPMKECPSCHRSTVSRVIHNPYFSIKGDPVNLGHLAQRNTDNMSGGQLEEKRREHAEQGRIGRPERPKAERPFWRNYDKIDTSLAALAPESTFKNGNVETGPLSNKAMDYIMKGTR